MTDDEGVPPVGRQESNPDLEVVFMARMQGSPYWSMKADQAVEQIVLSMDESVAGSVSVTCRRLMAIAWLQGMIVGTEAVMREMEVSKVKIENRIRSLLTETEGA